MKESGRSSVRIGAANKSIGREKMKKLILASLFLLANCASGPVYSGIEQPKNTAKIVVYRPGNYFNSLGTYWLEFNGKEVCDIHNAAFMVRDVEPGSLTISSSKFGALGTSRITLTAKAGETVYVKEEINGDKMFSGIFGGMIGSATSEAISENAGPVYLGTVNPDLAKAELQGLSQDCQ